MVVAAGAGQPAHDEALRDTQRAFDGVAAGYDQSNADNPVLRDMRERVRHVVEAVVPNGSHILDLGCGPGTDTVYFASRGYRVTAIDWSPAMVREAGRRVRGVGVASRADVLHLGIHELEQLSPARFDAAYSNFGSLNCVPDLQTSARLIGGRLRKGGV